MSCGCSIAHNGNLPHTAPIGRHRFSDAYRPVARDQDDHARSGTRGGEHLEKDQPAVVGKVEIESAFAVVVLVVAAAAVEKNQPVVAALPKMTRPVSPAGTMKLSAAEKRNRLAFDHQLSVVAAPFAVVEGAARSFPDFDGFVLRPEETEPKRIRWKRCIFASEKQNFVAVVSVDAERLSPDCPSWDQFLVLVEKTKPKVVG